MTTTPGGTGPPGTGGPTERITLGGGCFWCTEAVFAELRGVRSVLPGYSGGSVPDPSYEQVCEGTTGHAEVIDVEYDPAEIPLHDLLTIFFTVHDPTTRDRQGNDVGPQYRSVIFARSPEQAQTARAVVAEVEAARLYRGRIVTEIVPFTAFYPAEEYHRAYFRRNPERGYCQIVIAPKVAKFRAHFTDRLRSTAEGPRSGGPAAPAAHAPRA